MAKIKCKGGMQHFTGQIGPVRFADGEAETTDPSMLLHFGRDPERYEVTKTRAEQKAEQDAEKAAAEREAAEKAAQAEADKGADNGASDNGGK